MSNLPKTRIPWIGWGISIAVVLLLGLGGWLGITHNRLIDTTVRSSVLGLDVWDVSQLQRQLAAFQNEISRIVGAGRIEDLEFLQLKWDLVWSRWDNVSRGETGKALQSMPEVSGQLPRVGVLIREIDASLPALRKNPSRNAQAIELRLKEAIRVTQETYAKVYNKAFAIRIETDENLKNIQLGSAIIGIGSVSLVGLLLWITWRNQRSKIRQVLALAEEIQHSEERFRNLERGSIQGILVHRDGNILFANQAFANIFGYATPEEALSQHSIDAFNAKGEGRKLGQWGMNEIEEKQEPSQYEFWGISKAGEHIRLENRDRVVNWEEQPAIQSTMVDITQHKKTEEELSAAKEEAENATRIKDKFVSLVAHDLRAPLSSIKLMQQMVAEGPIEDEGDAYRETNQAILARCDSMLNLIDDLLKISRIQTGSIIQERRLCFAADFFPLLVEMKFLAQRKDVVLENELPENFHLIVDVNLFREVLQNLIDNAIKFSHRGGTVKIGVLHGPPPAIFVQDHGAGIPKHYLSNIFREEIKTSTMGTSGEIGTGLGLPICQDIMEALGGRLRIDTREGEGTTIYAELMESQPEVLVVEGEGALLADLRAILEPAGLAVHHAESIDAAVERLTGSPPHLILADLPLASQEGYRLIRQMRKFMGEKEIPMILMTENQNGKALQEAAQLGVGEWIRKPFSAEALFSKIRGVLS